MHLLLYYTLQGKLPLTGIAVNRLEDTETTRNSFEITGQTLGNCTLNYYVFRNVIIFILIVNIKEKLSNVEIF